MEFKDDGKPKQMTWRVFRPVPKPKPEPSVAPQKIILVPSKQTQNPQNASRISTGIIQQKPASTPGSPLHPKRGPITGPPITGKYGDLFYVPNNHAAKPYYFFEVFSPTYYLFSRDFFFQIIFF